LATAIEPAHGDICCLARPVRRAAPGSAPTSRATASSTASSRHQHAAARWPTFLRPAVHGPSRTAVHRRLANPCTLLRHSSSRFTPAVVLVMGSVGLGEQLQHSVPQIILCVPSYFRLAFQRPTGWKPFTQPPISLTATQPKHLIFILHTLLYMALNHLMIIFVFWL
jgi:hypothetical protein